MTLTLKNKESKREVNWNDTAMITMTREGDNVIVESFYKYGPPNTKIMTYKKFKEWRLEILKLIEITLKGDI